METFEHEQQFRLYQQQQLQLQQQQQQQQQQRPQPQQQQAARATPSTDAERHILATIAALHADLASRVAAIGAKVEEQGRRLAGIEAALILRAGRERGERERGERERGER